MTRSRFWLLFLAVVPLYLTWTFDHSLWNPDETRDAGIAAEMFRSGNYSVPTLNGDVFLEKPPLYYWTCALVYKLTGRVTAGTTRLPSALYGILGAFFVFLLGRRLFNERVGFFAAAILATSSQYFRMSHFAMMDVALATLVAGSLYFYSRGSRLGFAAFALLAFYAKGFLGIALPGIVVTLDLLFQRKPKELMKIIGVGALLFGAFALPWFWALWKQGGVSYLKIFLIDNHLHRFASSTGDHTEHSLFYYFGSFAGDFLPWTLVFLGFLIALVKQPRKYWESPMYRFSMLWFFSLLVFFTISSSKRSIYLLPLFPAASLLAAAWLDEALSTNWTPHVSKLLYSGSVALGLIAALAVVIGGIYFNRSVGRFVVVFVPLMTMSTFLFRFYRRQRHEWAVCSLCGLFALSICLSIVAFMKQLDADKTFVPLCDAIKSNQSGKTLVGFDMSEMERGVLGFYLDRTFMNVRSLNALKQPLLASAPAAGNLARDQSQPADGFVVRASGENAFDFRISSR